jgi:hypothetical protein
MLAPTYEEEPAVTAPTKKGGESPPFPLSPKKSNQPTTSTYQFNEKLEPQVFFIFGFSSLEPPRIPDSRRSQHGSRLND